jgi:hypothetical protein
MFRIKKPDSPTLTDSSFFMIGLDGGITSILLSLNDTLAPNDSIHCMADNTSSGSATKLPYKHEGEFASTESKSSRCMWLLETGA